MVKVTINLDKEMYQTLSKIEQNLQALVNYFETIEIQVDEKTENEKLGNTPVIHKTQDRN